MKGRHVRADRLHSHMVQLCTFLKTCAQSGFPCALFGAFGSQWRSAPVDSLLSESVLRKSYHRACHFGRKLDTHASGPSKICFVLASSKHVVPFACQCKESQQQHMLDWSTGPRLRKERSALHAFMAMQVAARWVGHTTPGRNTPDSVQSLDLSSSGSLSSRVPGFQANRIVPSVAPSFAEVLTPAPDDHGALSSRAAVVDRGSKGSQNQVFQTPVFDPKMGVWNPLKPQFSSPNRGFVPVTQDPCDSDRAQTPVFEPKPGVCPSHARPL